MRSPDGTRHATGLYALALAGDRICGLTRFDSAVLPWFGLLTQALAGEGVAPAKT